MLSQFVSDGKIPTLAALHSFPKDVYPVGRLDADSEGLLILTNDKKLNHLLLNPGFKHKRTYLVQVEGIISQPALNQLMHGVGISLEGKMYHTKPCMAQKVEEPDWLPARYPPVRFRKEKPTSFFVITLYEGKNRQIRRMTAAVGYPTLRLIRIGIEKIEVGNLQPGQFMEMNEEQIYKLLEIKNPAT